MRARVAEISAWFGRRGWSAAVALGYVAFVALFVWVIAQFYLPGKGFSYFITFGSELEGSRLSKVRKLDYYVEKASDGYDAQYYAQIAMDPSLQNRELRNAVDSLPYRARRILLPAVAHVAGLGDPAAILQAYALLNVAAWLLLAVLLLHWFPPRRWDDFIRWAGVLGSFGLCVSLRNALTDGPSLLLVATAVWLLDKHRPWLSTAVFALGGLAKETNLLAAAALAPTDAKSPRAWGLTVLRGLLVGLPLALWLAYIAYRLGNSSDAGARNFDLPLAAYFGKWREIAAGLPDLSAVQLGPLWSLLMVAALTVQFLFLVLRPQWRQAWWRIGLTFAVLMVFLGEAVWEGFPGAASRVLLPMQLAFNVLVPAGRAWLPVLLLGNLTLLATPSVLRAPLSDGLVVAGPAALLEGARGESFLIRYSPQWFSTERGDSGYWMWSSGEAHLMLRNPHPAAVEARLRLGLTSTSERTLILRLNGEEIWRTTLDPRQQVSAVIGALRLVPGDNRLEFATDAPGVAVPGDVRQLAFSVHNLRLELRRLAPAAAQP